jgi:gliding motility-associated-like protein
MNNNISINAENIFTKLILSMVAFLLPVFSYGQLQIDTSSTPQQLVQNILIGSGVTASNITFTGSALSIGGFSNGDSTNIGLDAGILLSTGRVIDAVGPNDSDNTQYNTMGGSDPQLQALIPGDSIFDAVALEFDFIPMSDTIRFQYVFASEEYEEWVGSGYNDVFGFFVTGANPAGGSYSNMNLAVLPGTSTAVSVNTINNGAYGQGPCTNCAYYTYNGSGTTIEYDGFTVVMTSWIVVTPCTSYHIKLAIGDAGDPSYDSGVFLKKNSFSSGVLRVKADYSTTGINNTTVEACNNATVSMLLDYPSQYNRWVNYTIGGTAINGVDYQTIPDSLLMANGVDSIGINIIPIIDGITEGVENIELHIETSSCSVDTLIIPISDYDSVEVQINSSSTAFCNGQSSNLSANPNSGFSPYSYLWSNNDTLQQTTVVPTANTNYSIQVTDACGIVAVDTMPITVYQRPTISASSLPTHVCLGDTSNLKVSGALTYLWNNGSSLSSTTGDSIFAWPNTTTTYTVIGTDNHGCRDTTQTSLLIDALPNIQSTPIQTAICINDSTDLTVSGGISYIWSPSASLSSSTASTVTAKPTITTDYIVVGTASNGCKNSDTSTVVVNPLPNISVSPANPEMCEGGSKTLTAAGGNTYLWSPATGLSSTTSASVIANPNNTITYIVKGTDVNTCENTDTVTLTVHQNPTITVNPVSANICEDNSTVITASGANTYVWSPSTGLSSTTGASVTAAPIVGITYTVVGTDNHGCTNNATSNISVSPKPIIVAVDTLICQGDSTLLNATAAMVGSTYLWSNGSTSQSIYAKPINTTTYYVTATDGTGCAGVDSIIIYVSLPPTLTFNPDNPSICIGESETVTVSGANTYSWTPLTNNSSPNSATTTLSPSVTTMYYVTGVSTIGCINTDSTLITVNPLPNVVLSASTDSLCQGDSALLTASGAVTYLWSPLSKLNMITPSTAYTNTSIPRDYVIIGTDANGCQNNFTKHIFVSPVINLTASPNKVCIGDSTKINVISSVPSTYQWAGSASTSSSFYDTPVNTKSYTVTVTSDAGCVADTTITVEVFNYPTITVTPDSSVLCKGSSQLLTANGALTYSWSPTNILSSATGVTTRATPTNNATVTVIGKNAQGCADTALAYIKVIKNVKINPGQASYTSCNGIGVSMNVTGDAISYVWSPATGLNTTTGSVVFATPNTTTTYKIVGTKNNGCMDSIYIPLNINPKPTLVLNSTTSHICLADSVNLTISGASTYDWSPAAGLSSTTGSSVYAKPVINTNYSIIGTTALGCKDTTNSMVYVHNYPTISLTPLDSLICPNSSTTMTANGATTYTWSPSTGLSSTVGNIVTASPDSSIKYTIIGDSYGCKDTMSRTVLVSPLPKVSGDDFICLGDTTTLFVSSNLSGTTYSWNNGGGTNDTIMVAPIINTTYIVTASDSIKPACTNKDTIVVRVNSLPVVTVNPDDTTICPGTSTHLIASGGNSYKWSPSTGLSDTTGSNVLASPSVQTTYQIIGSTPAGCHDTVYSTVRIFPQPNVNVTPVSSFTCGGSSQTLTASGAVSYSWSPANGLSATTGAAVNAGPALNQDYVVTGTDANSCVDTAISHVFIYSSPIITATSSTKCPEDTVKLTATTQNSPTAYSWSTGETTKSIFVSQSTATTYYVTVTYPSCVKTGSKTIAIYADPAVIASTSTPLICHGDTASLTAINGISFSWTGNNLISNSGGNVKANPLSLTKYYVEAESVHHCITNDSVEIDMHPFANVSITATPNHICIFDTSSLVASGASSYAWSPNINITSLNTATTSVFPTSAQNYQVIGTDVNGCRDTATQLILVNPGPNVTISPTNPLVCQGDTVDIIASGAVSYIWWPLYALIGPTNDTAKIHPLSNTVYHVRGTDAMGCSNDTSVYASVKRKPIIAVVPVFDSICHGDSIQIDAFGVPFFSWKPYNTLSDSIGTSVIATPTTTTTYIITGMSTDGCTKEISSTIKVNPNPILNITPTTQGICIYDTTTISINGAVTYDWSPQYNLTTNPAANIATVNPIVPTTYKVIGTNIFGCKDSLTSYVDIYQLPNVTVAPANPSICFNDSVQLNAPPNNTYTWTPSNTLDTNATSSVWASPHADETYYITGIDTNNCVNHDTVDVIVHPEIFPTVNPLQDSICFGLPTTLTAGGGNSYLWSPSAGLSSINTAVVTANPSVSTTYTVNVFDVFGCSDSIQSEVTVLTLPSLTFTPPSSAFCYGLQDTIEVSGAMSYVWSPNNDISTTIGDSVIVGPPTTQYYVVEGTDSLGCIRVDSTLITIYQLPPVQINPQDTLVCYGDSTNLIATGANQYIWSPAIGLSATSGDTVNTTVNVDIMYYLTGTDTNTCVNYDSVQIYTGPKPAMTISITDTLICAGRYIGLSGTSDQNPTEFVWSTGDTSVTSSDYPMGNITYTLYGKTPLGCRDSAKAYVQVNPFPDLYLSPADSIICDGDSIDIVSIQALNNLDFTWNTGQTSPDIHIIPQVNSTYTLIASDSIGCSDTATSIITLQPIPTVTISANEMHVCAQDSVILTANPSDSIVSYSWNIGASNKVNYYYPTSNTTYAVEITDSVGCQANDSIDILVNPIPQMFINPQDSFICILESTTLTASSNISVLDYLWNTNQTTNTIGVNPTVTTTYSVRGTDSIGCSDTVAYTMVVHNLPILNINPSPGNICYGDSLQLQLSSNIALTQYTWSTTETQQNIWVAPLSNSLYTVTATDIFGCVNDTQNYVFVHPNPIINIIPKTSTICSDSSLQLVVNTNIPAQNILWNTGDTVSNPIYTPLTTTSYSVVLTDTNGCFGYDTSLVNVIQRVTCNLIATSPICSDDTAKIEYQGTATSAAICNWNFDGGTHISGSGINPQYVQWGTENVYSVTLDVTENGCTSRPDTIDISVLQSPVAGITSVDSVVCDSLPVFFFASPVGMTTYEWHFGDPLAMGSDTSSLQDPDYVYNVPGTYTVSLSVVSPNGCSNYTQRNSMILINPTPGAGFSMNPEISYTSPVINFNDESVGANDWSWDFGDPNSGIFNYSNNTDPYHIFQEKGAYTVQQIVRNEYGCIDTAWATALLDNAPSFYMPDAFTPNGDGLNDFYIPRGTKQDKETYHFIVYDRWGRIVFETRDYSDYWDGTHYKTGEDLNPGVFNYILEITDKFEVEHFYKGSITLIR